MLAAAAVMLTVASMRARGLARRRHVSRGRHASRCRRDPAAVHIGAAIVLVAVGVPARTEPPLPPSPAGRRAAGQLRLRRHDDAVVMLGVLEDSSPP